MHIDIQNNYNNNKSILKMCNAFLIGTIVFEVFAVVSLTIVKPTGLTFSYFPW